MLKIEQRGRITLGVIGVRDRIRSSLRQGATMMSNSALTQLEDGFKQLSTSEQLYLIERLVHHVHDAALKQPNDVDAQLALMASDPQIQNEIRRIEREFSHAEADGLETT
jgi:hypothetical protein